jgi:hypothetical protein
MGQRIGWYIFLLILIFLIVTHRDTFKSVVNSLSSAFAGNVVALQGGNPSKFVN